MTQVGSVYGQALYSLAADEGLSGQILEELRTLQEAFQAEPDFVRLLSSPNLTKDERIHILDDSFQGKVQPYVLNFMKILTEKGHMRHFAACCESYRAQYNEDNGILPVRAATAVPLTAEQAKKLSDKLSQMTGKRVDLQNVLDPDCLGGVRLDYDGKQVDDTVRHRLDAIHRMLKNTIL